MRRPAIGRLRHRVELQSEIRVADGGGGATSTWSIDAVIWAAIEPLRGRETLDADAVAGMATHQVRLRYRTDLAPGKRFVQGSRVFEIRSVLDPEERRRFLVCHCEELRL